MKRTEVVIGAIIFIALLLFVVDIATTATYWAAQSPSTLISDNVVRNILAGVIVAYLIVVSLVSIWAIRTRNVDFQKLTSRYTVRATIPGSFVIALMPLILGIFYSLITHETLIGAVLSLLSVPVAIIFLTLELKKIV